jgi:enterochelin esterase-like enzyme
LQSPSVSRLLSASSPASLEEFWAATVARGTPLIEPRDDESALVTFLWRGEAPATSAWWGVDVPMARAPGTDLWYGCQVMPSGLLTTYCFAHEDPRGAPDSLSGDGTTHVDLCNPLRLHFPADPADPDDEPGWVSILRLPAAPESPWTEPRPGVPAGRLTETVLPGTALGGRRPVVAYQPGGPPTDGLPALVVFDGFLARKVLRIPTALDNLIAAGAIPPMVALFVSSFDASRERDLEPTPPILAFVEGELLPWARSTLRTAEHGNLIAGVSRGGLAAVHVGLRSPALFGGVIAQSGSFWWPSPDQGPPGRLIREVAGAPRSGLRFYLDVGVRETFPGPGGAPDQLTVVRRMRDELRARGFPVTYAEYVGGHDYINWRRTFADGLVAVAGTGATTA